MPDPTTPPKMVLPPPAPQNELEGLRAGYQNQNEGVAPEKGVDPTVRIHPDQTRHPITKKFQGKY